MAHKISSLCYKGVLKPHQGEFDLYIYKSNIYNNHIYILTWFQYQKSNFKKNKSNFQQISTTWKGWSFFLQTEIASNEQMVSTVHNGGYVVSQDTLSILRSALHLFSFWVFLHKATFLFLYLNFINITSYCSYVKLTFILNVALNLHSSLFYIVSKTLKWDLGCVIIYAGEHFWLVWFQYGNMTFHHP